MSEIDTSCDRLTLLFAPPQAAEAASRAKANSKGKGRADITELGEEEEETDEDNAADGRAANGQESKAAFALEGNSNTGSFRVSFYFVSTEARRTD